MYIQIIKKNQKRTESMKKQFLILIFILLPKSLLSRIFGYLTRIPFPQWILRGVIKKYCNAFEIKTDEFETPRGGFRNFDSFFTRELKEGVHRVDKDPAAIVSPVDARIDQYGEIDGSTILQAKGVDYSLHDLVPSGEAVNFEGGSFMTLYLSPADYHRIHSPVSGSITGYFHIPGKLYTVQEFMVKGLRGLFSKNERLISYIETEKGKVAVCKIGAMNVGRMSISHSPVVTNRAFRRTREVIYEKSQRPSIKAGEELGMFHLGSTIILLFEKDYLSFPENCTGNTVRVGQRIGELKR